jgi:hypothetical protein
VTLRAVLGHANVIAQAEDVVLNHLKPKPRRPWRRLRDVTTLGDRVRQVMA